MDITKETKLHPMCHCHENTLGSGLYIKWQKIKTLKLLCWQPNFHITIQTVISNLCS